MFARPFRVSLRVGIRGLHHRIIALAFDVALRPERVPPVRAFDVAPPLIVIVERNFAVGRREDYCAGYEILLGRSWELLFCWRACGNCDVTRRPDELLKLRIGQGSRIHPKSSDGNNATRLGLS